jgi:hypothetical protein
MSHAHRRNGSVADPGRIKLADQPALEPALTLGDVCKLRRESRRTAERERSAGLWPSPDFFVGTGTRKSPRWRAETVRRWIEGGGKP